MRIFYAAGSDPMLLDSQAHLAAIHDQLVAFLAAPTNALRLPAEQDGSPAPYETFLPGLQVIKGSGPIVLSLLADHWLNLEGSEQNLRRYVSYFCFEPSEESGHHHPEHCDIPGYMSSSSLSLIIEADATWGESSAA